MSTSVALGWRFALPLLAHVLPAGPAKALAQAHERGEDAPAFKAAVTAFQKATGLTADGDLGPKSWARFAAGAAACLLGGTKAAVALGHASAEIAAAAPAFPGSVPSLQNYVRIGGAPVPVPAGIRVRLDHRKPSLVGRKGCVARNALVMHWGGLDQSSCYNVLKGRRLGTHLIAECGVGEDGILSIAQTCDLADTCWHAGEMNRYAIGLDVARSPLAKYAGRYPGARVVPNPTPRGDRELVALPEGYGAVLRPFIAWLAQIFGLEYRYQGHQVIDPEPDGTVVHPERIRGVVGHHNVDRAKWDVAPWHADLWPADGEVFDFSAPSASAEPAAAPATAKRAVPAPRATPKAPPRSRATSPGAPAVSGAATPHGDPAASAPDAAPAGPVSEDEAVEAAVEAGQISESPEPGSEET